MTFNWIKVTSDTYPEEIDYTSSPTTIYLHRNIKEVDVEGVATYEYEEAKLTPAEFAIYSAAKANNAQLTIMEALADLYKKVGE